LSLNKNDIITIHRKDGTETKKVIITKPYFGLTGYAEAKELGGLDFFTREKLCLWKDVYGDLWVEETDE